MKYLFKTIEVNQYGTASFEVFVNEDGSYLFAIVTYKGYGTKPGNASIKIEKNKFIISPTNHQYAHQILEKLNLYFNSL